MKREADTLSAHSALQVQRLRAQDEPGWERFVDTCQQATFFHRLGWKRILEQVFGHRTHYLLALRGDTIAGVLPLAEVRSRLFGHRLASLPFCVYGGAACTDDAARALLNRAAADLAQALRVDHLELRNRQPCEPDWPRQELYVTFRKALTADIDANMQAIPGKQRAMVRKGMKAGLRSVVEDGIDTFFALYADNMQRHGTPALPLRYFRALRREFGPACEVLTVFDRRGTPLSSVLSFYFRDEVLPYYAGDRVESREVAANDFKYWELMRMGCERGCRVFDYGRSRRDSGSFHFKRHWGFAPEPLHYEYQLVRAQQVPQHNPHNEKYRLLIAIWQRLPRPLVDRLGPALARSLG